ncbi:MAG: hypothetical protein HY307_01325 [Arcobacter sp.]|nr:hypothetical protein [Arcobacter sp.]
MENLELDEDIKENFFFLSEKESFWFDLTNTYRLPFFILDMLCDTTLEISYESLIGIAKNISTIVYEYCDFVDGDFIEDALNKMCKLYNFDEKDTSRMILSGYLSNIGLLKIPQHIVQKPQQLTSLEYEIIKSAPYHTKQILLAVFGFDDIVKLASSIYERIDGSGYPYKLDGSELGLKNRVLSVVFIAKALGENRKYRKAFLVNDILNELEIISIKSNLNKKFII